MEQPREILLVEADTEARGVVFRFLGRHGTARSADSLREAVSLIEQQCPDVLLLDPDLPDGDGMELIARVRRTTPWAQISILCRRSRTRETAAFIEAGANDVLGRPFDLAVFLPRLEYLCRAVTSRKGEYLAKLQLQARLRHADGLAMLGTALATVSHEVASPLTVVMESVSHLERQLKSNDGLPAAEREDLVSAATDALQAARAMRAFMARIRSLARPQDPTPETASLAPVIEIALLFLKQKISRSLVSVTPPPAEVWPHVPHVPNRLVQAVVNVVANAIEATGPNGLVEIRCAQTEREVAIEVEDDGPGPSSTAKHRMLEPFFTTKQTGTGLGMSVVQDVMREHGGRLELADGSSGGGLCVRLVLARS